MKIYIVAHNSDEYSNSPDILELDNINHGQYYYNEHLIPKAFLTLEKAEKYKEYLMNHFKEQKQTFTASLISIYPIELEE